jgi:hypothetical protein
MQYSKKMGSGEGKIVNFLLKEDQLALLDQLMEGMPDEFSRGDLIRGMVMPYIEALTLAKEGKNWMGALEFGKGLVRLKNHLREQELKANQAELDFNQGSVMDLPETVSVTT